MDLPDYTVASRPYRSDRNDWMRPICTEDGEEAILDIEARNARVNALKSIEADRGCYHCHDFGAMVLV